MFGMGTGVTSPPLSPGNLISYVFVMRSFKTAQELVQEEAGVFGVSHVEIEFRSSPRSISTGQLNASLHLHTRPINHLVLMGSYPRHLRAGWENSS